MSCDENDCANEKSSIYGTALPRIPIWNRDSGSGSFVLSMYAKLPIEQLEQRARQIAVVFGIEQIEQRMTRE
jgi:hypothetical protein